MGPGSIGPSITVMQPDGADDEKIWRKFGETWASQKRTRVPLYARTGQANSRWDLCMCVRARVVLWLIGEELWHSLEVSQFGEKRKAKEDEGSEGGELKQEDIGETIHVQHT
eukprot:COSAG02_NODE_5561_length_4228_cov_309.315331_2_plen_112_part_00